MNYLLQTDSLEVSRIMGRVVGICLIVIIIAVVAKKLRKK